MASFAVVSHCGSLKPATPCVRQLAVYLLFLQRFKLSVPEVGFQEAREAESGWKLPRLSQPTSVQREVLTRCAAFARGGGGGGRPMWVSPAIGFAGRELDFGRPPLGVRWSKKKKITRMLV